VDALQGVRSWPGLDFVAADEARVDEIGVECIYIQKVPSPRVLGYPEARCH
jgi:hypothetical protein